MTTTIVFTRHRLTEEQAAAIAAAAQRPIVDRSDLASVEVNSLEQGCELLSALLGSAVRGADEPIAIALYGVVPVALRAAMCALPSGLATIEVVEAVNVRRSREGAAPTFEFGGFLRTGRFS